MVKRVQLPDGSVGEFPDDFPDSQIETVLRQQFGGQTETKAPASSFLDIVRANNPLSPANQEKTLRESEARFAGTKLGLKDAGRGAKRLGLLAGEKIGLADEGSSSDYAKSASVASDEESSALKNKFSDVANQVGYGQFLGEAAPFLALPGGLVGGLARRAATTGLAGAATGATQLRGGVAGNSALGASLGLLGPAGELGFKATKVGFDKFAKPALTNARDFLFGPSIKSVEQAALKGVDESALARKAAADELGLNITPAEASGNKLAGKAQGNAGQTDEGASLLDEAQKARAQQEKGVISSILDEISPSNRPAASEIRQAARSSLDDIVNKRKALAEPLYESSRHTEIPAESLAGLTSKYPVISSLMDTVSRNEKIAPLISGLKPNSVGYLDLVKREIDSMLGLGKRQGTTKGAEYAGLKEAKNALIKLTDDASPDYKAARAIFSDKSEELEKLSATTLGRIANLPDDKLKNVSKIVFDTTETDIRTQAKIRKAFSKKAPDAWNRLVRNEMERRLARSKQATNGTNFYKQFLAADSDYKTFLTATRDLPNANRKLKLARNVFGDLIKPENARTAAAKAANHSDTAKTFFEFGHRFAKEVAGNKYDKALVEFITNKDWDKSLMKILAKKGNTEKSKELIKTLNRINQAGTRGAIAGSV